MQDTQPLSNNQDVFLNAPITQTKLKLNVRHHLFFIRLSTSLTSSPAFVLYSSALRNHNLKSISELSINKNELQALTAHKPNAGLRK